MLFDTRYPSVEDLRKKAKKRIPKFAFEYLEGGCNEEVNLIKNTADIRKIELIPRYLKTPHKSNLKTKIFDHTYDAPFGIAPVGLQGMMWPNAPEILARAAFKNNVPFVLSTVTTSSLERIGELTEGNAWFQLYHPAKDELRNDLINRAQAAQYPVLMILCDVPTFGYRSCDIKNGLAMPPKISIQNIVQTLSRPKWALNTLRHGLPTFEMLKPYMSDNLNLKQLGLFMDETFDGKLWEEKIKPIRDMWQGKLVLKGVASLEDTATAIRLGIDGIVVSNHGGRQLDVGESSIRSLTRIVQQYKDKITIMMDSGLRSGPDIARCMASGADFTFMGRSFMYGVAALGKKGGNHTVAILKRQLLQVMEQLCCKNVQDLPDYLNRFKKE